MVYNFNLGIGWASSGVEYAQSYRANLLRRAHIPARFVFTDMFPTENIEHIPITDEMDQKEKIKLLSERIVRMFTEDDMDAFSGHSYEKAKEYLTKEVVHRWIELLK